MAVDADIKAAFADHEEAAPKGNIDPDVAAAFQSDAPPAQPRKMAPGKPMGVLEGLGTMVGHAGMDVAGGVAHQVGNLSDIIYGVAPGPGSWASRFSKPFQHDPDAPEADQHDITSVKEYVRQQGPKLDPFSLIKNEALRDTLRERIPQAAEGIGTVTGALGSLRGSAFDVNLGKGPAMAGSPQSISAAASGPNLSAASPELREAARAAQENGTFNRGAFEKQLQAESLPVPGSLTKGQATGDPALISFERNTRGKNPEFATKFNEQNQNIIANLDHMREEIGPDVFSTNQVEHGDTLIKAYEAKAAKANAGIKADYQALLDANGGKFPVDAKALKTNVENALHSKLLYEHAPTAEMAQLKRAAESGMNFEQYEAMRTNLARIMRSSSDGNEIAAASAIRKEMENLPLSGDAAALKPLADKARASAKAQFDAVRADPAYAAVVNGKASPDNFVSRFVINGDRDDVALMKRNLADNPTAQQTMGVAALDHIRQKATNGGPTVSQAGYNRALQNLDPKAQHLFTPAQRETLGDIGEVARNQQAQPAGSFVNNSNTTVAAHASGMVKNAAEAAVNAKAFGLGTLGRKYFEGRAAKKLTEEHLAPGAGVDFASGNP